MAQPPDHYAILYVDPSAPPEVIRAAYHRLVIMYHPDKNRSSRATGLMVLINGAYAVLKDPVKRAEYDRIREIKEHPYSAQTTSHYNVGGHARQTTGRQGTTEDIFGKIGYALGRGCAVAFMLYFVLWVAFVFYKSFFW